LAKYRQLVNCVAFTSPWLKGDFFMSEKRIAVVSIIIENRGVSNQVNDILSDFGDYVVGRMGIPYREKNVSVICVVVDAPAEIINTLTGKIGMLEGVSAKTIMSKK
jgi:putative iron-only hydrogenase system regulator